MKSLFLLAFSLSTLPAWAQPSTYRSHRTAAQRAAEDQLFTANPAFQLVDVLGQWRIVINGVVQWQDSAHIVYSNFNSANLPQRELIARSGHNWSEKFIFQYNAAGQITSDSSYHAATPGSFGTVANSVTSYSYNAQNQLLTALYSSPLVLSPSSRRTYSYNAQGQNTAVLEEAVVNGSLQPQSRRLLSYNAQGQVSAIEYESRDGTSGQLVPVNRNLYIYNAAGQIVTEQYQRVDNGAFVNAGFVTATYNGPQNQLSSVEVPKYELFTYTYDANNNLAQIMDHYWSKDTQSYYEAIRISFSYQRAAVLSARTGALNAGLSVAPNPANQAGVATLHYTLPSAALTGATVLDLTGRTVATLPTTVQSVGPHTLALPITKLSTGLYIVQLTAGTQSQRIKLRVE
ncbi:T9SS type A sorting domain-containing protein [Hymenobacter sp. 5317J-9]|uniref:T9SS type A sorting domain-containing protein n=1 Tax=Hymenobacter sp. 5317J-9 TaxID=2932250 RepID=UPI001FD6E28C|nr:T9SS type A sorting domain-containing protein [Hymenobacter sp. 5317J-9]UOQ97901.1 T9SS type A sorting domain-containing protein [Hymenobacter sp. 5317J-9]